jgi:hypothetical protein
MKEKFIFSYTEKLAVSFGNNTMILLSYHDLKKEKTRKEKFYDKFGIFGISLLLFLLESSAK